MSDKKVTVIGGKLKLKGSSNSSNKLNKKRKVEDTSTINSSNTSITNSSTTNSSISNSSTNNSATSNSNNTGINTEEESNLTEAEKRYRRRKLELEQKSLKKLAGMNYRDRIDNFNNKLASLTEHNDIPRVSAAGNG